MNLEWLKSKVNLVEFLTTHYGMEFKPAGRGWAALSPFTGEKKPSFHVNQRGAHWLFNDFSSGASGSIIDFVRLKENINTVGQAVRRVLAMLGLADPPRSETATSTMSMPIAPTSPGADRSYDVEALYEKFRGQDANVCRLYLIGRGIDAVLVDRLIREGLVVHNRYQDVSYCCFVVRDAQGRLQCLDNHQVNGPGKFVLGNKVPFSLDWAELKDAKRVFLCEGIIDYLSLKCLELDATPGLALLGNRLLLAPSLLKGAERIICAADADEGGTHLLADAMELLDERRVVDYPLEGHKDPNELLRALNAGKRRQLTPRRKLDLCWEFVASGNKSEVARRWRIDRSYLYELVEQIEAAAIDGLEFRQAGRPPEGMPMTLEAAHHKIRDLEHLYYQEAKAHEAAYIQNEFMKLRVKWTEIENAELRGEQVDQDKPSLPLPNRQVKKKRKKRR
jgi:DNA primase